MRKILLLAIMCCAGLVSGAGGKSELSSEVLRPERFPQLLTSREELAQLRAGWAEMPHLRQYVEEQRKIVVPLLEFSDDELRRLVPPAGAPIVYGLGMNLDPYGERLRWTSWKTPFKVMGRNNVVYPNADYPDDGSGCGKDGKKYYFTARAYGFVCSELEERVLPALGDLYALTGEKQYAHVAAVLLDAVAGIYPANRRGPLDYPGRKADRDRSGRLQRAYYMVARGLENYANTLDLITASGELEAPSAFPGFASIREHVAANLLRDGGEFCYDWAMEGGQLNNGLADYVRGAAYAGLLLRDERLLTPLLKGPSSLRSMLDNNVDRNGFYFEVSTTYSVHTTELYCAMAGIADAAVRQGLAAGASFYRDPGLVAMMDRFFIRRELSGHMPTIGDDGPDRFYVSPTRRLPEPGRTALSDRYWSSQLRNSWRLLLNADSDVRGEILRFLRTLYGDGPVVPPVDRLTLFRITPALLREVASAAEDEKLLSEGSIFYGAKGLALLRGGRGDCRYGAQLAAGMQNNHGQREALTWTFFSRGHDWSNDPGYYNSHYRHSWTQMTVAHQSLLADGKSFDPRAGGGYLNGFLADDVVQYALAVHPGAYRPEGVSRYERMIAQRPDETGTDLGYWLDIGIIAGGEFRDDSFHTAMKDWRFSRKMTPVGTYGMFPGLSAENRFRRDYRLTGFEDRHFRCEVPGNGYALLTQPQSTRTGEGVGMELTDPAFIVRSPFRGRIKVDFPGAPDREYIAAVHPGLDVTAPVAYLIRRDRGKGGISVFLKIIRVVPDGVEDPVNAVETPAVRSEDPFARACRVSRSDGLCDVWLTGKLEIPASGNLPAITGDVRLALLVFDRSGKLLHVRGTGVRSLRAGDFQHQGPGAATAAITAIRERVLTLDRELPPEALQPGSLILVSPPEGIPATFTLARGGGRRLEVADQGFLLARGVPVEGDPEDRCRFSVAFPISRFTAPMAQNSAAAALGKTVLADGKVIGRIVAMAENGREFTLDTPLPAGVTAIDIAEAGPGDVLEIPLNLSADPASTAR